MVRGRGRAVRGCGNGRVQAKDVVAAEPNLVEVMAQLHQDQRRVVDKLKMKRCIA